MKWFRKNDAFVLRDIGGIYFAVDIKNKRIYDEKKILSLNRMAYTFLSLAEKQKVFSSQTLGDALVPLLLDNIDSVQVYKDIELFLLDLQRKGIIELYE